MVLIWGLEGHSEVIGATRESIECPNCSNIGRWRIVGIGKQATVCFIPTAVKYRMEYAVMCKYCTAGISLGKGSVAKKEQATLSHSPRNDGHTVYGFPWWALLGLNRRTACGPRPLPCEGVSEGLRMLGQSQESQ